MVSLVSRIVRGIADAYEKRCQDFARNRVEALLPSIREYLRSENVRKGIPDNLDGYKEKFKDNLIGIWSDRFGTSPVPTEQWEFYPDGTGITTEDGSVIWTFQWRECEPYCVELQVDQKHGEPEDIYETSDGWFRQPYGFKIVDYYSDTIVMYLGEDDSPESDKLSDGHYFDYIGDKL